MLKFITRRSDLPLDRDGHSLFLPWLIALMVFLAVLAVAGILILSSITTRWNQGVTGTLTVQISSAEVASEDDPRLQAVLDVLASTKTIYRYEVISDERVLKLLKPWLGEVTNFNDLPIPRLIDVELHSGAQLDTNKLVSQINKIAPGSSVDDHQVWLERMVNLIETVQILAILVLLCIGLATVGTVVFTTQMGLAVHHEAIDVLHLIGAQDAYIAGQFAGRALALGLTGGLLGLVLGIIALMGIGSLMGRMDGYFVPDLQLVAYHWLIMGLLPVGVAVIAMITARMTVLRSLRQML
jgi:cell division transport system permease protein